MSGKRPKKPVLRPAQLLPNLMTLGAIAAGLSAIRLATEGAFSMAVALIALAALLDALDGATARLLKSESAVGAELDSLADFVNFGVAPGLVLYLWTLQDARGPGWIAMLIYAVCCALRLARFNVEGRAEKGPKSPFFRGVPAPGGALIAFLPMAMSKVLPWLTGGFLPVFTAFWLVATGLMMISRQRTPSLRVFRISRERAPLLMVGLLAAVAAGFTWPWPVLLVVELGYLALLARYAFSAPKPAP